MQQKTLSYDPRVVEIIQGMTWSDDGLLGKFSGDIQSGLFKWVANALEAMGGRWNTKKGGYAFLKDARPTAASFGGELKVDVDEFFETPIAVTDKMVSDIGLSRFDLVLEPSAGRGAIIKRLLYHEHEARIIAIEQNAQRCDELMKIGGITVSNSSFEDMKTGLLFDRVFMNPPFRLEKEHIARASAYLTAGGKLASVCSEATFTREDEKSQVFQRFVEANGRSVKLPTGTFRQSGTTVDTRLVYLEIK